MLVPNWLRFSWRGTHILDAKGFSAAPAANHFADKSRLHGEEPATVWASASLPPVQDAGNGHRKAFIHDGMSQGDAAGVFRYEKRLPTPPAADLLPENLRGCPKKSLAMGAGKDFRRHCLFPRKPRAPMNNPGKSRILPSQSSGVTHRPSEDPCC